MDKIKFNQNTVISILMLVLGGFLVFKVMGIVNGVTSLPGKMVDTVKGWFGYKSPEQIEADKAEAAKQEAEAAKLKQKLTSAMSAPSTTSQRVALAKLFYKQWNDGTFKRVNFKDDIQVQEVTQNSLGQFEKVRDQEFHAASSAGPYSREMIHIVNTTTSGYLVCRNYEALPNRLYLINPNTIYLA